MPLLTCPFVSSSRSSVGLSPKALLWLSVLLNLHFSRKPSRIIPTPGVRPMACHLCSLTCPSTHTHVRCGRQTCFRQRSTSSAS